MAAQAKILFLLLAACCLPAFSHAYDYDALNRIESVSESGAASWARNFSYDRYGNRAADGYSVLESTPNAADDAFDASNNRLKNPSWAEYDNAGNLTRFLKAGAGLQWTASYDAENKQRFFCAGTTAACGAANKTGEYVYDGEGNRIRKIAAGGAATTYVYDAFGRLAAEYAAGGPAEEAGTFYRTTDHLGSTRLVSDSSGDVVSRRDFFPFGEQIPAASSSGRIISGSGYNDDMGFPQLFTAKERDDESGLDYFGARYMASTLGRFTSANAPFMDQSPGDPRSWNLYSYTRNNPLRYVDSSGNYMETAWDVANVGLGVASFIDNVRQGNYGSATLDAVGVVLDSAAVVAPLVPAGAGVLIKGARGASQLENALDAGRAAERVGGSESGAKLYRGLAKGENPAEGLKARSPGAGNSEASHVAGKKDTQWISTTKDRSIAEQKYGAHGVVEIDPSKLKSGLSDVSGGGPGQPAKCRLSNYARKDQEVLIKDEIPAPGRHCGWPRRCRACATARVRVERALRETGISGARRCRSSS